MHIDPIKFPSNSNNTISNSTEHLHTSYSISMFNCTKLTEPDVSAINTIYHYHSSNYDMLVLTGDMALRLDSHLSCKQVKLISFVSFIIF